ncbi:hypothetical protein [Acinetobacter ursingii]|uniref:hypothetical protein n=1 Tax=Acinetobacter ursingii TaxID=108980 RepID=UPI001250778D|nr:hypothetical protein [Acinetobacter ursingii]
MKIKNLINNILAISFVALLFLFAFTWIVFDFNNSSSSLKDTWSIVSSLFGGFAALVAAFVAVYLFNDWREQKDYEIKKEYIEKFAIYVFDVYQSISSLSNQIQYIHDNYRKNTTYTVMRLDKIDFTKIVEKDKMAHYHSNFLGEIIPESRFKSNYENFQEFLTHLCFINEKVCEIYFKKIINEVDYSPFISLHFEKYQMNQSQLSSYNKLIEIISKSSTININNKVNTFTYSELLKNLSNSFDILNAEIIKYLKP